MKVYRNLRWYQSCLESSFKDYEVQCYQIHVEIWLPVHNSGKIIKVQIYIPQCGYILIQRSASKFLPSVKGV